MAIFMQYIELESLTINVNNLLVIKFSASSRHSANDQNRKSKPANLSRKMLPVFKVEPEKLPVAGSDPTYNIIVTL